MFWGGGRATFVGILSGARPHFWLLFGSHNISHRMYRTSEKVQSRFYFALQLNLKRTFLSSTCIARPLIYVGVSLHSNKKQKSSAVVCLLNAAQGHQVAVNQRPAWEALLCVVPLKHLQLLAFMCRPACFLATQTLHMITCSWLQMKQKAADETAAAGESEHNHSVCHDERCEESRAQRCETL